MFVIHAVPSHMNLIFQFASVNAQHKDFLLLTTKVVGSVTLRVPSTSSSNICDKINVIGDLLERKG